MLSQVLLPEKSRYFRSLGGGLQPPRSPPRLVRLCQGLQSSGQNFALSRFCFAVTLVFHLGKNRLHEMFAIFSDKWQLDTFVFDMEINSIGAYKLSAIVSRKLKQKEAFF